jgi:Fe2+ transport system protein B
MYFQQNLKNHDFIEKVKHIILFTIILIWVIYF